MELIYCGKGFVALNKGTSAGGFQSSSCTHSVIHVGLEFAGSYANIFTCEIYTCQVEDISKATPSCILKSFLMTKLTSFIVNDQ